MTHLNSNHFIDLGDVRLPIKIKKHRTSRRLIIRYQPTQKTINLTLPQRTSIKQGLHFINEKREWILQQIHHYSEAKYFCDGAIIPVLGQDITLKYVGGRGTENQAGSDLQIYGESEFMARRVKKWLTQKATQEIITLAKEFSSKLGVKVKKISLRDTTSRWGSCSIDGNLSFSWRLVFAPREVLAYVVAHEVAHLVEHNHSQKFWNVLEQIFPEYEVAQKWLKESGTSLYGYGSI